MSGRLVRHAALGATLLVAATAARDASGDPSKAAAGGTTNTARPAQAAQPRTAARAPTPAPKRATPAGPIAASRTWHTRAPGAEAPRDASGRPMLTLQGLNIPDRVSIPARSERGGFAPDDLDRAAHVLRDPRTGNEHPMDPRLLDLVYRIQSHFTAPEIRIISGYRTPHAGTNSNHGKGRAMDIVVPGAADEDVAKFVREQGFVGCGVYPVSGFVHVDIRDRSYFWVDTSGPGKKSRIRGILGELAARADADALRRGERPIGPFLVGRDVDALLAAEAREVGHGTTSTVSPADEDDDDGAQMPAD